MRKTFSLLVAAPLLAASLFASTAARADGAVVRRLPDADHASLAAQVAKARQAAPADFKAVDRIAGRLGELDASRRGRVIPVTPMLKSLGARAFLPMLERAALQSNPRGDLSDVAWRSWRIGLIESIGLLHDRRSLPLFTTVLAGSDTDHDLLKVTSESIGRVGDEAAISQLVALARQPGARQIPLLAGLGESHRTIAAQALSDAAHGQLGALDDAGARHVAKALGHVGSAWAWKLVDTHRDEEAAVRALAARALVDLFVARSEEVRSPATAALLMVDDPSTPALIAQARQGASPELAAALDALAQRVAKNPLR